MVLVAIDAASVKRNKIKLTCSAGVFALIRRSWGSVAVVVVNADGWWPACSGRCRCCRGRVVVVAVDELQWEIKRCNGRGSCVAVEDGRVAETKLKHCNGGQDIAMVDGTLQ